MADPRHDGGDQDLSGKLSDEDQAEYDRLEALEAERATEPTEAEMDAAGVPFPSDGQEQTADLTQDPDRHGDAPEPVDPNVDPAAGIDTEAEEKGREVSTYATPWGLRPLPAAEAEDLRRQGLAITEEPDLEPDTSLEGERADLASLPVVVATEHRDTETKESEDFGDDGGVPEQTDPRRA